MRGSRPNSNVLFIFYGCVFLLLGSQLLMRDTTIMFHLHRQLPVVFLVRFGAFWCIGIIGAVLLFLLYLHQSRVFISRTDKLYAIRLSKLILTFVSTGAALSAVIIYYLATL